MVAESWIFNRHCEPVRTLVWQSASPGTFLVIRLPTKDCHVARVLLAMTSENRRHHRKLSSAARRAHGSSAEHAMRDLIASNAPLREGRHKARQNGPKHYPGDSRGRSPLARLSPLSFVVQRKMGSPKGVGIAKRPVKTYHLNDGTTDSP